MSEHGVVNLAIVGVLVGAIGAFAPRFLFFLVLIISTLTLIFH
jgi:hypothetical protein